MLRLITAGLIATIAMPALAIETAPPGGDYKKVSELVELPEFLPGIGTLYVDPATLPAGPFLAYDHEGELVSTIYMVGAEELAGGTRFDNLTSPHGEVDHVDIYHNAGHPGVEVPHSHVVLWHVPEADEARVAQ